MTCIISRYDPYHIIQMLRLSLQNLIKCDLFSLVSIFKLSIEQYFDFPINDVDKCNCKKKGNKNDQNLFDIEFSATHLRKGYANICSSEYAH